MKYDPDRSTRPRDTVDLDGCALIASAPPVPDHELAYVVLAGGLEGVAARQRIEEYARVLSGRH